MFVARYVDSSSKLVVESKPFSWSTLIGTPPPVPKNSTYDELKSEVLGVKIETTSAVPLAHALQKIDIEEDDDEVYDGSGAPLRCPQKLPMMKTI